jgi:Mce-associated membrane protein
MNPTWYDVLGVRRDATPEQIKAAWRGATDKFEPGTGAGQFRMFNEAADVLLDPVRRREYDASLDAPVPDEAPVAGPSGAPADEPPERDRSRASAPMTILGLLVLPLLAVAAVVVAVLVVNRYHADQRLDDDRTAARASAERSLDTVLAYDYRRMDAVRAEAEPLFTSRYRPKYLDTFKILTTGKDGQPGPAEATKTIVTASVLDTSVVAAEPGDVRVLAFVDQTRRRGDQQPAIFQNRVVATMRKSGNQWLIDDLQSY